MAVTITRLNAVRGDTNTWNFIFTSYEDALSILFTAKIADKTIFQKTLGDGISIAENGITATVGPLDTYGLEEVLTTLRYDIQVTWASGRVETIFAGPIFVYPDVS